MATATLSQTTHLPETAMGAASDPTATVNGATSGALSTLDALSNNIGTWANDIFDRFFPPEQRRALLAKIKAFVLANPKVSAFLGMNIALTGIPLGLFTLFGLSVAVFSVLGGIIIGLMGAGLVTLTCVGLALAVVFPILMFTTASACFLFLFGLGGYKILKWASSNEQSKGQSKQEDGSINVGETLNSITGGRLSGLLDSAESEREKGDIKGFSDENNPPQPPEASKVVKKASVPAQHAANHTPVGKVTKRTSETATTPNPTKALKTSIGSPTTQRRNADESKAVASTKGE